MNESNHPTTSIVIAAVLAVVVVAGVVVAVFFSGGAPESGPPPTVEGGRAVQPLPSGQAMVDEGGEQPASVDALVERIRQLRREPEEESNQGRLLAIRALGELRTDRSREALRKIAEKGADRFERLTAMSTIWAGDDRDYLIDLAARSDDPVVRAKLKALQAAEGGR